MTCNITFTIHIPEDMFNWISTKKGSLLHLPISDYTISCKCWAGSTLINNLGLILYSDAKGKSIIIDESTVLRDINPDDIHSNQKRLWDHILKIAAKINSAIQEAALMYKADLANRKDKLQSLKPTMLELQRLLNFATKSE